MRHSLRWASFSLLRKKTHWYSLDHERSMVFNLVLRSQGLWQGLKGLHDKKPENDGHDYLTDDPLRRLIQTCPGMNIVRACLEHEVQSIVTDKCYHIVGYF